MMRYGMIFLYISYIELLATFLLPTFKVAINGCNKDVSKLLCIIMRAVQKTTAQNTNTIMESLFSGSFV